MVVHLLELSGMPIYEQLRLEEALLRVDDRSWCLCNVGTPPAIVMGVSGDLSSVDEGVCRKLALPLVRRFSGGGTVVVDEETCFVTFLFNHGDLPLVPLPESILEWSAKFYAPLFPSDFALLERDYVIGRRKCGGNAQCLTKKRWLHHTSFLWNFSLERMESLFLPGRRPQYRGERSHADFLCTLCELGIVENSRQFIERVIERLTSLFPIVRIVLSEVIHLLRLPHRTNTSLSRYPYTIHRK